MKRDIWNVFFPNLIKMFVTVFVAFLIPRWLSIEEYGYVKLFQLYTSYIGLFSLGYSEGAFIKYGGKEINNLQPKELADEQATLIIWQTVLSLFFLCVAGIQNDIIIFMTGLSFVPTTMITYFLTIFQSLGMFHDYSRLYNAHSILTILSYAVCLYLLKLDKGIVFVGGTIVVNYIVYIYILIYFNTINKIPLGVFKWEKIKQNVQTGIMIAAGNMAYVVFSGIDKWFVKLNEGMASFSYYSFAVQLLASINMFANPIAYTLFSHMSKKKSQDFEVSIKRKMLVWLFFLLTGVYILKAIIRSYIPQYMISFPIIDILFLGQIFYSLNYSVYVNLFKVYKMQKQYFFNMVIIIVLSVIFNCAFYFGIEKNMVSFAYATALSMIIWAILNLQSFSYLKLHKKDLVFVFMVIGLYFFANKLKYFLLGALVYGVVYIVLIYFFMKDIFMQIVSQIKDLFFKIQRKNLL